jgi:hypothetical protein
MRRLLITALATLAALSAAPTAALADSAAVIRDCQDGRVDGKYSQREFAQALRNIPTDVDEYTDCRDVIRRAQLGAAGGSGASGGGAAGAGGGAPPSSAAANAGKTAAQILQAASPAERAAVAQATGRAGAAPVVVGGRTVSPDTSGLSPAGAANVLPVPLIVALVLLGGGLAAAAVRSILPRVLARRRPST